MSDPLQLVIGDEEGEHLMVQVLGRERPASLDAEDGNWITARVGMTLGAFRGQFSCCLRAEDFATLLPQLRRLDGDLGGSARFSTMEGQLEFELRGDGRGRLDVRGSAIDAVGTGNRLIWSMVFDQTYLRPITASVLAISTAYPVRGRRMSN